MREIAIFLFLVSSLINFCYAGEECQVHYEYGYIGGYEGGIEDRENGYKCNPAEYYNLPLIQITLKAIKEQVKKEGHYIDEYEFDKCFKEGFLDGYRDGYYSRPKKKMKYKWNYEDRLQKSDNYKRAREAVSIKESEIFNDTIIHLKNGNKIEGSIVKKTDRGVFLRVLGGRGEIFIRNEEIEKIEAEEVKIKEEKIAEKTEVMQAREKNLNKGKFNTYCYSLGYRWGRCATLVFFGRKCPPKDDFVTPVECRGHPDNDAGLREGVKSVYIELGIPTE